MRRPDSIFTAVHSVFVATVVPVCVAVLAAAAALLALAGASSRTVHRCYRGVARFGILMAGTRVETHGYENIDPDQAYVVVPNHESNWDSLVLLDALRGLVLRFVVKSQLMRIPILGQGLRLTGSVEVMRRRNPGDVKRLRETMNTRDPDVSMLFYAEGSRARNGSFREFKKGAFATALDAGLPILPVATAGTYRIYPPETFWFRRGNVVVEVGTPIPTDKLGYEDRDALRDQTHEAVGKLRARARERLRARGLDPGGID